MENKLLSSISSKIDQLNSYLLSKKIIDYLNKSRIRSLRSQYTILLQSKEKLLQEWESHEKSLVETLKEMRQNAVALTNDKESNVPKISENDVDKYIDYVFMVTGKTFKNIMEEYNQEEEKLLAKIKDALENPYRLEDEQK